MDGRCAWEGEGWQAGQVAPCVIPVHHIISEVIGEENILQHVHFTVLFGRLPRPLSNYSSHALPRRLLLCATSPKGSTDLP